MSHFTVLVVADNQADLEKKLLPYHEYECTGIEEYVEFVPTDLAEAAEKMKKWNASIAEKYPDDVTTDMEKFIPEYYGAEKNEQGVWGRRTNPNAKWDWWVVGGRWSGSLLLKDGRKADSCKAGELDTEKIIEKYIFQHSEKYDKWRDVPENEPERRNYLFDNNLFWLDKDEADDLTSLPKDEYIQKYAYQAFTYALVDLEGGWHAKGKMGWFGVDSNHDESYDGYFWRHLESLNPEQNIFVVDCHI